MTIFNDTQTLVVAQDIPHAIELLQAAGFPQSGKPWRPLTGNQPVTLHGDGSGLDLRMATVRHRAHEWARSIGPGVLARYYETPVPGWYREKGRTP